MNWCNLLGHKWPDPGEWKPLQDYPDGYQIRTIECPRCKKTIYRQVRDESHKLIYY